MSVKANHNGQPSVRTSLNGSERQRVADIQRARMLTAMAQAASEHGAANVTVAHIVGLAGVSRRTFYELFGDIEDCFLAAFEHALQEAQERVQRAYSAWQTWRDAIRSALLAFLEFLDADPFMASLMIVETSGAGARALKRRQDALAELITAIEEGHERSNKPSRAPSPPLAAEGVIGAVLSIVHNRMLQEDHKPLVELINPLMSIFLLPYLGVAAARRELQRPTPTPVPRPQNTPHNPLRALDIRLTYRTVCVLTAVAENPGSSNKHIADASGINDQGQISKLLARLQKLGLVQNNGPNTLRGEPNAWTLTQTGQHIHASIAHAA